jgi:DNA repair exonuclease SbcCD ATPase subunit
MMQNATKAANTANENAQELEKSKVALSELTLKLTEAQEQLANLKGDAAEADELRAALERERDVAGHTAREIEALKNELVTFKTSRVDPAGATSSTVHEKDRPDAVSQQLNVVQYQLSALRESEAKLQGELEQERGRSASATRAFMASQEQISALKAQAASAAATLQDADALKKQSAHVEAYREHVPAVLLFQTTPVLTRPSPETSQGTTQPRSGATSRSDVSPRKARQASLPQKIRTEGKLSAEATTQTRRLNLPVESVEQKSVRPPSGNARPSAGPDRNTVVKPQRFPRLLPRGSSAGEAGAPDLPASLLPADELWSFY